MAAEPDAREPVAWAGRQRQPKGQGPPERRSPEPRAVDFAGQSPQEQVLRKRVPREPNAPPAGLPESWRQEPVLRANPECSRSAARPSAEQASADPWGSPSAAETGLPLTEDAIQNAACSFLLRPVPLLPA